MDQGRHLKVDPPALSARLVHIGERLVASTRRLVGPDPAAWQAWKTATFGDGDHIWHAGLGVELVTRLRGPAREHALPMLRDGLALGDDHAARALAAMDAPADAPAHLESCRLRALGRRHS